MEPEILVLDEPVAGLDPAGREEILSLVTRLRAEVSPTVIMVSHYMDDIARMADRIVALKDGRIVADGNPHEVFGAREELAAAGLSLPTAARVVDKLAARGIALSRNIVTGAELVDALAEYRQKVKSTPNAEDGTAGEKNEESVTAPAAHTADGAGETADDDAGTAGEKNEESVTAPAAHTADGAGETANAEDGTAGEKNEESVTAPAAHTADGAGETADDDAGTAGEKNEESVTAPAGGKDV